MKTLLAVLLGSSMALSFSAKAITCEDLWNSNPQSQSEAFIMASKSDSTITDAVKRDSVRMCESAFSAAGAGVSLDRVISTVQDSARKLPDFAKASMLFMTIGGWQLGTEGK